MDSESATTEKIRGNCAYDNTVRIKIDHRSISDGILEGRVNAESHKLSEVYNFIEKIGQGGMGSVYLALDRTLGRHVAIKRLNNRDRENASMRERFFREGRAVALLNHIHIVHIYSVGEDNSGPYIVMEYVAGPMDDSGAQSDVVPAYTLADRINREGNMPLDAALDLLIKLCRALEYAHSRNVIHRDIKPTNVLLDECGEPKIVDFGLARVKRDDVERLTLPGEKMLSLGYGAPEQEVDAGETDERGDVYGLGALLYFCVTGKNPRYFRQSDLPEVLRMPVIKALETDREKRWGSVELFRKALQLIKSPGKNRLKTSRTIWRCKWCDEQNPVAIRFCGKCGWDGGAFCPECGSEFRFGIQYCGVCGADAKSYENAQRVLDDMLDNMQRCEFGLVGQAHVRIAGFRPQGVNGRALIDKVHHLADQAALSLRRRGTLREEIKREYREQNYEQVRKLIREYDALAFDNEFADMSNSLDDLQSKRDLQKLRELVGARRWGYAGSLAGSLRRRLRAGNLEFEFLDRRIRRHEKLRRGLKWSGVALVALVVYALSGAPVYRMCGEPCGIIFRTLYAPLSWMQSSTPLHRPLTAYAAAYRAEDMFR